MINDGFRGGEIVVIKVKIFSYSTPTSAEADINRWLMQKGNNNQVKGKNGGKRERGRGNFKIISTSTVSAHDGTVNRDTIVTTIFFRE